MPSCFSCSLGCFAYLPVPSFNTLISFVVPDVNVARVARGHLRLCRELLNFVILTVMLVLVVSHSFPMLICSRGSGKWRFLKRRRLWKRTMLSIRERMLMKGKEEVDHIRSTNQHFNPPKRRKSPLSRYNIQLALSSQYDLRGSSGGACSIQLQILIHLFSSVTNNSTMLQ